MKQDNHAPIQSLNLEECVVKECSNKQQGLAIIIKEERTINRPVRKKLKLMNPIYESELERTCRLKRERLKQQLNIKQAKTRRPLASETPHATYQPVQKMSKPKVLSTPDEVKKPCTVSVDQRKTNPQFTFVGPPKKKTVHLLKFVDGTSIIKKVS